MLMKGCFLQRLRLENNVFLKSLVKTPGGYDTLKKIAWVTDSVSCISEDTAEKYGINVVPLSIIFDGNCYKDGIELTNDEFYEKLKASKVSPTTSQPAVGDFVLLYEKLKQEYEMGIAIHVTSKVSGTLNASMLAAEIAGFNMVHIDSKIGAKAQEYMMLEGARMDREGYTGKEIAEHLQELPERVRGLNLIGSLEQLHKGGRVSGVGMVIGNLLQIRPIIEFQNGELVQLEKVRTTKKAENRIFELFKASYTEKGVYGVAVIHSNLFEKAGEWKARLSQIDPSLEIEVGDLSPVISAHVGEGTIGLMWFEKKPSEK